MNKYQKYPTGNKDRWEQLAENIVSGNLQVPQDEVPEFLGWLRDMNWPGARLISGYLKKINPEQLVKPIIEILNGEDYIWSYWILIEIVANWSKFDVDLLKESIEKLLVNPDFLSEDGDGELQVIYDRNFK